VPEPREPFFTFEGVIAVLFGLITLGFGIVLVLRPIGQGFLLIAPVGVGAIGFGARSIRARAPDRAARRARVLPLIGLVTGLLGAALIVAGMVRAGLQI
jgi:hypothetical protein